MPAARRAGRGTALGLALALAGSLVPGARGETPDSDPRAVQIADRVMDALGGAKAWNELVGLRWTFEGATRDTLRPGGRRHAWNKQTGWHRVEGTDRQGRTYVIVHDLGRKQGKAWVDGVAIEGDSLQKLLTRARSLWTNDTYWLLMPYKLRDPGVRLRHDGEAGQRDSLYDRLALSFEGVGETPGDRYWVYVRRGSNRIERWEHLLQNAQPPPKPWTWEGWERHGGLWFPTAHRSGDLTIYTRRIETVSEFPAGTFTAP